MNDLTITRLFSSLPEPSPVRNKEMQIAYAEFIEELKTQNQSETDYTQLLRTLNLTHIEFQVLQAQILYE